MWMWLRIRGKYGYGRRKKPVRFFCWRGAASGLAVDDPTEKQDGDEGVVTAPA